jgi:hypothetical protein
MNDIKHDPNCPNKNCVGGVITRNGSTGRLCRHCNPLTPEEKRQRLEARIDKNVTKLKENVRLITEQFLISKGWKKIGAMINGYDLPGKSIECEFYDGEICIYNEYGPLEGKMYNGPIPTESQYEVLNQLLKLHD